MKITILGCYSATPRKDKHTSSQIIEINGKLFLIDCGEGTQMQLRKAKIKFNRINHIFISHLHGDHFYGLIGLISTFRLLKRESDLHIYGPTGIKDIIILQLKSSKSWTDFNLFFHEISTISSECIYEDDKVNVFTIPLKHRIYTNGYLIKEKPYERKLLIDKVLANNIDIAYYRKLRQGSDVYNKFNSIIKNTEVTTIGKIPKSYAFCSDTAYSESIVQIIKNVNVLYHESTFLEKDKNLCAKTMHSTAKQAAKIAKLASVEKLILGHFSSRYKNLNLFRQEAETVFSSVELAEDGKTFNF